MKKGKILYDSYCKVCNLEIEHYKKIDKNNLFEYVDIMGEGFEAKAYNLKTEQVHKYFHVINNENQILIGVDAFAYIWNQLDTFPILQRMYHNKIGNLILNLGYKFFVRFRKYLPRKKCDDNYCNI